MEPGLKGLESSNDKARKFNAAQRASGISLRGSLLLLLLLTGDNPGEKSERKIVTSKKKSGPQPKGKSRNQVAKLLLFTFVILNQLLSSQQKETLPSGSLKTDIKPGESSSEYRQ